MIPLLIAGARGTAQLLDFQPDPDAAAFWTQFLMGLDGIFLVVGVWAFEPIVSGD